MLIFIFITHFPECIYDGYVSIISQMFYLIYMTIIIISSSPYPSTYIITDTHIPLSLLIISMFREKVAGSGTLVIFKCQPFIHILINKGLMNVVHLQQQRQPHFIHVNIRDESVDDYQQF